MRRLTVNHSTSTAHRLVHYDGVCGNIHGHNIEWDVELYVDVPETDDAMALDFKDVSEVLDEYDHALVLNEDDPIFDEVEHPQALLGKIVKVDRDPTTEHLSEVVAERFVSMDNVFEARVKINETDKYGMSSTAFSSFDKEVTTSVETDEGL